MANVKLSNLPTTISFDATTDYIPIIQPSVDAKILIGNLIGGWTQSIGTFTAAPASTSTLTMTSNLTAKIPIGSPIEYVIGGTIYYGIVTALTSNLMTIAGAPLGGSVTALYYGDQTRITQMVITIPSTYEAVTSPGLISSNLYENLTWGKIKSYLVQYMVWSRLHDTGAHGKASVMINGTEVNATPGGLTIAADATLYYTVVDIDTSAYDINRGEAIEITSVKNGNGDAHDLTVTLIFITP